MLKARNRAQRALLEKSFNVFIAGLEAEDENAYRELIEPVISEDRPAGGWRNYAVSTGREAILDAAIAKYRQLEQTRAMNNQLRFAKQSLELAKTPHTRIVALLDILKAWRDTGFNLSVSEEMKLGKQYLSAQVARTQLQEVVTNYADRLFSSAREAIGTPNSEINGVLLRFYYFFADIQHHPVARDRKNFSEYDFTNTGVTYKIPDRAIWLEIINRSFEVPTLWDLQVPETISQQNFVKLVMVEAIKKNNRLNAKIAQAYLIESPELRDLLPQPILETIYYMASTGTTPKLTYPLDRL